MGTNYYAEWRPSDNWGGPVTVEYPQPVIKMHICKSLVSFQGQMFASWDAWKHFLINNEYKVTIRDEYGTEHDVREFVAKVEAVVPPFRPVSLDRGEWTDPRGFKFYAGEFS